MKKMLNWLVPIKSFAAMFFTGFIILYMIIGSGYAFVSGESFEFAIPFMYVIQSMVLSVFTSLLWMLFFSDVVIKTMRYFLRMILFALVLLPLFAVCLFVFYTVSADWTRLWLIISGLIIVGVAIISLIFESYFKLVSARYTEALRQYNS